MCAREALSTPRTNRGPEGEEGVEPPCAKRVKTEPCSSSQLVGAGGGSEHDGSSSTSPSNMGVGSSACKGNVHPQSDDPNVPRSTSTVTRLPFLPVFEDRPPFVTDKVLCERDSSLLKALTHHRTPFAVVETDTDDLKVMYASGGWVAGMGMAVESIEGTSLAMVLKKGLKATQADQDRLVSALRSKEVSYRCVNEQRARTLSFRFGVVYIR